EGSEIEAMCRSSGDRAAYYSCLVDENAALAFIKAVLETEDPGTIKSLSGCFQPHTGNMAILTCMREQSGYFGQNFIIDDWVRKGGLAAQAKQQCDAQAATQPFPAQAAFDCFFARLKLAISLNQIDDVYKGDSARDQATCDKVSGGDAARGRECLLE